MGTTAQESFPYSSMAMPSRSAWRSKRGKRASPASPTTAKTTDHKEPRAPTANGLKPRPSAKRGCLRKRGNLVLTVDPGLRTRSGNDTPEDTPPSFWRRPPGALIPAFCSRPPPSLGREQDAAHLPQPDAADVPRFWLGRSVARRLLPRTPTKVGRALSIEANDFRCLRNIPAKA